MKKITLILSLSLILVNLFSFEKINPAAEMSGKYLRFASYNQKSFYDIEDGFNHLAISIAKPAFYRNWSIASDAMMFGDDVFNEFQWNISPAYNFSKNYTLALSLGIINKSLQTDKLIFTQTEDIDSDSVTEPILGASFQGKFMRELLEISLNTAYLNQPDLSFLESNEKAAPYIRADLAWKINKMYKVGFYFKNEDKQNYFGLNFDLKFPYPNFEHKLSASTDKVSYNPSFSLINHWQVGLGYDLFFDNDLGQQNLELNLIYEHVGKEKPRVTIEPIEPDDKKGELIYTVSGADRFAEIEVSHNSEIIQRVTNIWDDDAKTYQLPLTLDYGPHQIEIMAVTANGSVTTTTQYFTLKEPQKEVIQQETEPEKSTEEIEKAKLAALEESKRKQAALEAEEQAIKEQEMVLADLVLVSIPERYQHDPSKTRFLHEVKKGETLWQISQREDVFGDASKWTQLYNINGMIVSKPDLIYPEQLIYIENNSRYDKLMEYTIKKGDNLWDIGYGRGLDLENRRLLIISNQDRFPNPNLIYPGEKITIKIFIVD